MQAITTIVLAVQMLTAVGMIGLILLQHGKGADMGAAFGSGASGSLFGATGSANFLSRSTAVLAGVFFACTLLLAYFSHSVAPTNTGGGSVLERAGAPVIPASAAGPAGQIPGGAGGVPTTLPAAAPAAAVPAAPAASGAAQIPSK